MPTFRIYFLLWFVIVGGILEVRGGSPQHAGGVGPRGEELNISRQAVIKTLLRRALNEQYVAAARLAMK